MSKCVSETFYHHFISFLIGKDKLNMVVLTLTAWLGYSKLYWSHSTTGFIDVERNYVEVHIVFLLDSA